MDEACCLSACFEPDRDARLPSDDREQVRCRDGSGCVPVTDATTWFKSCTVVRDENQTKDHAGVSMSKLKVPEDLALRVPSGIGIDRLTTPKEAPCVYLPPRASFSAAPRNWSSELASVNSGRQCQAPRN